MIEADLRKIAARSVSVKPPSDASDAAFVFGALRRQSRLIFAVMAAAAALGVFVLLFATPVFRATSTVLIDFKRLAALDENFTTSSGRIDSSAVLSQIQVIKSQSVVDRVVASQKLDEDPEFIGFPSLLKAPLVLIGLAKNPSDEPLEKRRRLAAEALEKVLEADRLELSYAILIAVTTRDADKSARLANAAAEAYISDQLDAKRQSSDLASDWFTQRIAELQKDVADAEGKVLTFRIKNNIVTNDGKFIDEQQISDLSGKFLQATFARANAEAKVASVDELARTGGAKNAVAEEFSNEVIIKLRNAYLESQRISTDLAIRYGATHEAVIKERTKAMALDKAIQDEVGRIQQAARSELAVAKIGETTIKTELGNLSDLAIKGREAQAELGRLEAAAATVRTIRDTFMSRYVDGIQKQSFPMTEARVISQSEAPTRPSFPTPFKTIGGGLILGFGVACMLAIGRETFTRRIRTRRRVEDVTGLPCQGFLPRLASLPALTAGGFGRKESAPGGMYLETLRTVKVNLDLRDREPGAIIGVTAVDAGQGATVTASHLAQFLASNGSPTLLVDMNFRNSTASTTFTPTRQTGLFDIVQGRSSVTTALQPTYDEMLQVLPAYGGVRPANPGSVLLSEATRVLIRGLRQQYTYVVLDLPALGVVAEASAAAEIADAFLLVIEWDKTEDFSLDAALRSSKTVRDKLIGSVLNKADMRMLALLGEPTAKAGAYAA